VYDARSTLVGVVLDPDRIQYVDEVDPGELNREDVQKAAIAKFREIRRHPRR
jgi:hypothetical protein